MITPGFAVTFLATSPQLEVEIGNLTKTVGRLSAASKEAFHAAAREASGAKGVRIIWFRINNTH